MDVSLKGLHDFREHVETEENVGDDHGEQRRAVCRRVVNAERDGIAEHAGEATQRQRVREGYRRGLCAFEHAAGRGEGRHFLFQGSRHLRREPAGRNYSGDVGAETAQQAIRPMSARIIARTLPPVVALSVSPRTDGWDPHLVLTGFLPL